jgi:uncharacterized membrane protein SpoIIM required for sporulation
MKERDFIHQNKDKWARFERLSAGKSKDPEELSSLFIELTNDLSYAKTHYPRRTVRVYLNGLAQKVFLKLYKRGKNGTGAFVRFWNYDLPLEMYRARKALLVSFLFFAASAIVGVVSTMNDPSFPAVMLSEDYLEMTEDNIARGDPMAVYKGGGEALMFLEITMNNIRVSFLAFFLGILFGAGTLVIMVQNGIMLGAFQYFFHTKGLLLTSFLTIWIHGALEISAIVIAGAAGLTLGSGLIFTGSYSRSQALFMAGRKGVRIMIGLVPIFIAAGFLEGFVTRHTEMPAFLKMVIILTSFAFIIGYFVIYPWRRFHRNEPAPEPVTRISTSDDPIELAHTSKPSQLFAITFRLYGKVLALYGRWLALLVVLGLGIVVFGLTEKEYLFNYYKYSDTFLRTQLDTTVSPVSGWLWIIWSGLVVAFAGLAVRKTLHRQKLVPGNPASRGLLMQATLISTVLTAGLTIGLNMMQIRLWLLVPFIIHPVIYFAGAFFTAEKGGVDAGFKAVALSFKSYTGFLGNFISVGLIAFSLFFILFDPFGFNLLRELLQDVISWHLLPETNGNSVYNAWLLLCWIGFIGLLAPLLILLGSTHFWQAREEETAGGLMKKVQAFGTTNKKYE